MDISNSKRVSFEGTLTNSSKFIKVNLPLIVFEDGDVKLYTVRPLMCMGMEKQKRKL